MGKHVYLIHGLYGRPDGSWRPWLKDELEKRGYAVEALAMPDADKPKPEIWIKHMQESIVAPDEDTIIVAHSLGGLATLLYLSTLADGVSVGKVVCVAGVVDRLTYIPEGADDVVEDWLRLKPDNDRVRRSAGQIVAFFSDNDPIIPPETEDIVRTRFDARTVVEHEMGHYNGKGLITEVPGVLAEIVKE